MSTEQQLAALHVQLSSLAEDLRHLVVVKPTAPKIGDDGKAAEDYTKRLDAIDKKLKTWKDALAKLKGQGPAYQGKDEDAFRAKQREKSFQQLVDKVEVAMKQCIDLLAKLLAPTKAGLVEKATDLADKLDEFLKMLHATPELKTSIGHGDGAHLGPVPHGHASPEALLMPLMVGGILVISFLHQKLGAKSQGH
jgi:DNA repair exonuclease SbcCD ATPase subunit